MTAATYRTPEVVWMVRLWRFRLTEMLCSDATVAMLAFRLTSRRAECFTQVGRTSWNLQVCFHAEPCGAP